MNAITIEHYYLAPLMKSQTEKGFLSFAARKSLRKRGIADRRESEETVQ